MPKVLGGSVQNHRRITRERVFEAFAGLVADRGYDATSLADVASAAGMSRATMYNYFSDKDALVVAFAEQEAQRHLVELRAALDDVANPIDRLRTYIELQFRSSAASQLPSGPALEALLPDDTYARVVAQVASVDGVLQAILEDSIDEGYLRARDMTTTIRLVAACIGTGASGQLDPDHLDEPIRETEDFILCALGVRLSPDGRPRRLPRR